MEQDSKSKLLPSLIAHPEILVGGMGIHRVGYGYTGGILDTIIPLRIKRRTHK